MSWYDGDGPHIEQDQWFVFLPGPPPIVKADATDPMPYDGDPRDEAGDDDGSASVTSSTSPVDTSISHLLGDPARLP